MMRTALLFFAVIIAVNCKPKADLSKDVVWYCETICDGCGGKSYFDFDIPACICKIDEHVDDDDVALINKTAKSIGMAIRLVDTRHTVEIEKREIEASKSEEDDASKSPFKNALLPTINFKKLSIRDDSEPTLGQINPSIREKSQILGNQPNAQTRALLEEAKERLEEIIARAQKTPYDSYRTALDANSLSNSMKQITQINSRPEHRGWFKKGLMKDLLGQKVPQLSTEDNAEENISDPEHDAISKELNMKNSKLMKESEEEVVAASNDDSAMVETLPSKSSISKEIRRIFKKVNEPSTQEKQVNSEEHKSTEEDQAIKNTFNKDVGYVEINHSGEKKDVEKINSAQKSSSEKHKEIKIIFKKKIVQSSEEKEKEAEANSERENSSQQNEEIKKIFNKKTKRLSKEGEEGEVNSGKESSSEESKKVKKIFSKKSKHSSEEGEEEAESNSGKESSSEERKKVKKIFNKKSKHSSEEGEEEAESNSGKESSSEEIRPIKKTSSKKRKHSNKDVLKKSNSERHSSIEKNDNVIKCEEKIITCSKEEQTPSSTTVNIESSTVPTIEVTTSVTIKCENSEEEEKTSEMQTEKPTKRARRRRLRIKSRLSTNSTAASNTSEDKDASFSEEEKEVSKEKSSTKTKSKRETEGSSSDNADEEEEEEESNELNDEPPTPAPMFTFPTLFPRFKLRQRMLYPFNNDDDILGQMNPSLKDSDSIRNGIDIPPPFFAPPQPYPVFLPAQAPAPPKVALLPPLRGGLLRPFHGFSKVTNYDVYANNAPTAPPPPQKSWGLTKNSLDPAVTRVLLEDVRHRLNDLIMKTHQKPYNAGKTAYDADALSNQLKQITQVNVNVRPDHYTNAFGGFINNALPVIGGLLRHEAPSTVSYDSVPSEETDSDGKNETSDKNETNEKIDESEENDDNEKKTTEKITREADEESS